VKKLSEAILVLVVLGLVFIPLGCKGGGGGGHHGGKGSKVFYVNGESTGMLEEGTIEYPFKTIQAAVYACEGLNKPCEIRVGEYMYEENIGAHGDIKLMGGYIINDPTKPDFSERDPQIHPTAIIGVSKVIPITLYWINPGRFEVDGFTILGGGIAGIMALCDDNGKVVISNNIIGGNLYGGVMVAASPSYLSPNSDVINASLEMTDNLILYNGYFGFMIRAVSDENNTKTKINVKISNNSLYSNYYVGGIIEAYSDNGSDVELTGEVSNNIIVGASEGLGIVAETAHSVSLSYPDGNALVDIKSKNNLIAFNILVGMAIGAKTDDVTGNAKTKVSSTNDTVFMNGFDFGANFGGEGGGPGTADIKLDIRNDIIGYNLFEYFGQNFMGTLVLGDSVFVKYSDVMDEGLSVDGNIDATSVFVNAPIYGEYGATFADPSILIVNDANFYALHDIIEIDNDGVAREISAINIPGNAITFIPAFTADTTGEHFVLNYGPGGADGGWNFHLFPGSPCENTGDPDIRNAGGSRSDMGAYGGPNGGVIGKTW